MMEPPNEFLLSIHYGMRRLISPQKAVVALAVAAGRYGRQYENVCPGINDRAGQRR